MDSFIRLVINENIKLYKRKLFWILSSIIVLLVLITLTVTLNSDNPDQVIGNKM